MEEISINGTVYPIWFPVRVLQRWMRKNGVTPQTQDLTNVIGNIIQDYDKFYQLTYMAVEHGCKAKKVPFDLTEDEFGIELDKAGLDVIEKVAEIFSRSQDTGAEVETANSGNEKKKKAR